MHTFLGWKTFILKLLIYKDEFISDKNILPFVSPKQNTWSNTTYFLLNREKTTCQKYDLYKNAIKNIVESQYIIVNVKINHPCVYR